MAEIIGSVLLVGMTVVIALGFLGLLIFSNPGPTDEVRATFQLNLEKGTGGWGSGDEAIKIVHHGGQGLDEGNTLIRVEVDGEVTIYGPDGDEDLDHDDEDAFDGTDTTFTIGETWRTIDISPHNTINAGDLIHVAIIADRGDRSIVWSSSARAGSISCAPDVTPPEVSGWTQDPSDVKTTTTGPVNITITVSDPCDNLDDTVDPNLLWRLNDGSDPAWTDEGDMTNLAGDQWEGQIPSQTWSTHVTKTLEYRVTGMADTEGNTANSEVRKDEIQFGGTTTFIDRFEDDIGESLEDDDAKSNTDSGQEAILNEGNNGTTPGVLTTLNASADVVVDVGAFTSSASAFASDDDYARASSGGGPEDLAPVRYGFQDQSTGLGAIEYVVLRAEVRADSASKSDWTLQACNQSTCSAESAGLGSPTSDTYLEYNVTNLEPDDGSWSWTDINNLETKVKAQKTSGGNVEFFIDHVVVQVKYRSGAGTIQSLVIDGFIDNVPTSPTYILDLKYRASQDTFNLLVKDATTGEWTERLALNQGTSTQVQYFLDASEVDTNGDIEIRFTDDSRTTTQGTLYLDWVRVVST